ncbi:DUF4115 domain-containing protein [Erythrobacter sp. LQ02-29]|uniref:helix-turn-helix domain-containing protein n=1 Tax=Erythrobacter sp. LQ02-29 TaxID=2920384 RepID=UPI001F4EAAA4|nr:helix-turn-helix domain-containing protein [Erythrobacter sp. LQ02-29]MCP9222235.1 DUF4115 domain-containing protein [Erythrobacter sp. LQ02-29]
MQAEERTADEPVAEGAEGIDAPAEGASPTIRVGDRLKAAREERGLTLDQVADETKVPRRHLQSIEANDFASLPARTYALGFSRNYARAVGLDEDETAEGVRRELEDGEVERAYRRETKFEPGDPARVPSRGLVFLSIVALVLLIVGGYTFYRTFFAPGTGPGSIIDRPESSSAPRQAAAAPRASQAVPAAPTGPVVFTALMDDTWVKFYDGDGNQLMQKQMAKGESYTVPTDAKDPQVWTGRPYALAITVGGKPVPKLSEKDEIVKDVSVTPQALTDRANATPSPSPSAPSATPTSPT